MRRDPGLTPALLPTEACTVLQLAATGMTTSEIAVRPGVSRDVVRGQLLGAISALGARSKLEVVMMAVRAGLIESP